MSNLNSDGMFDQLEQEMAQKRERASGSLKQPCSEARARIDAAVRQVWVAYRDASDVSVDMLTEQDLELWGVVTRHRAIQNRLDATLPNIIDSARNWCAERESVMNMNTMKDKGN